MFLWHGVLFLAIHMKLLRVYTVIPNGEFLGFLDERLYEELLDYRDFINWHRTCRDLWSPLDHCLYGHYTLDFVAGAVARNRRKLKDIRNADAAVNIRLLLVVNDLCSGFCILVDTLINRLPTWSARDSGFVETELMLSQFLIRNTVAVTADSVSYERRFFVMLANHFRDRYQWRLCLYRHNQQRCSPGFGIGTLDAIPPFIITSVEQFTDSHIVLLTDYVGFFPGVSDSAAFCCRF
jgi:hypothetical protein